MFAAKQALFVYTALRLAATSADPIPYVQRAAWHLHRLNDFVVWSAQDPTFCSTPEWERSRLLLRTARKHINLTTLTLPTEANEAWHDSEVAWLTKQLPVIGPRVDGMPNGWDSI